MTQPLCQVWKIHYPFTHPSIPGVSPFPPVNRFTPLLPIRQALPTPTPPPVKTRPVRLYTLTRWAFRASRHRQAVSDPSGSLRASRWTSYGQAVSGHRASRLCPSVRQGRAVKGKPSATRWRAVRQGRAVGIGRAVNPYQASRQGLAVGLIRWRS